MSRKLLPMILLAAAIALLPGACSAETLQRVTAPPHPLDPARTFKWLTNYEGAKAEARRTNRLIMVYFSGSDWEDWTQKLEKDVFSTDLFKAWAAQHVVPLQIDFPKDKHLPGSTKAQNDRLKTEFTVAKVPTIIFLDPSGAPILRASYDDLKLRDEEIKGQPKAAIAFLEQVLKNRPADEVLKTQPDFTTARLYAKKNYAVMLMAITQGNAPYWIEQRNALFKDQQFSRFVNHNVIFLNMQWPEESDQSPVAKDFRAFVTEYKILPSPFQLVVWDVPFKKVKARFRSFSLQHVDQLIKNIQFQLPRVDYTGNWIDDYNLARTISAQTDRHIFMAFTDNGQFSQQMDKEIFKSEPFLTYAHKNFVLLRIDHPKTTTQPAAIITQNRMLDEAFNIAGYPMVIVLNEKGEKIADSKYLKGGPDFFMKQLVPIVDRDADRLAALKEKG